MTEHTLPKASASIIHGPPLAEEEGLGALTLGGFIRDVTARYGDREVAVLHSADGTVERWSYADLWDRSMAVARALVARGIGKGMRVGILMTNRLEFLSAVFGTALAGGVATTFSTFSAGPELDALVAQSGCSFLLLERFVLKRDFLRTLIELEPQIESAQPGRIASRRYPFLRHVAVVDSAGTLGAAEGWAAFLAPGDAVDPAQVEAAAASVMPSDPGVLFFSSGSTGKPKGILSAHRGVCLQLWRWPRVFAVGDDVRCWSSNGFFFSGNFANTLGMTLAAGGSLILQRYFDADEALDLMEKEHATMLQAWPHQWAQLMASKRWAAVDLSALKYIDAQSPIATHPTIDTRWPSPVQAYGNTETFTISSIFASGTPESEHGNSHGKPFPGNSFKIVDPLTGIVLPLGERGEIAVKGATLMLGYIGIPLDETLDDEGYFATGDGGYVDGEGRLFWEGRLNDIIKTGGANVSPLEVDAVLRECPGVKMTQTVGVADELLGEVIVACIVPQEGVALTADAVRGHAKQHLASYKIPRKVLFLDEADLKTTGSAKIKTADLRALATRRLADEQG